MTLASEPPKRDALKGLRGIPGGGRPVSGSWLRRGNSGSRRDASQSQGREALCSEKSEEAECKAARLQGEFTESTWTEATLVEAV